MEEIIKDSAVSMEKLVAMLLIYLQKLNIMFITHISDRLLRDKGLVILSEPRKIVSKIRSLSNTAREYEEKGYNAYREALKKARSKALSESLVSIAIDTYVHMRLWESVCRIMDELLSLYEKVMYREDYEPSFKLSLYYDTLQKYLEFEKDSIRLYSDMIVELQNLKTEEPRLSTMLELLIDIIKAVLKSEKEHHDRIEAILKLARR